MTQIATVRLPSQEPTASGRLRREATRAPGLLPSLSLALVLLCGCQSSGLFGSLSANPDLGEDGPSIDNLMGPTERRVKAAQWEQERAAAADGLNPIDGMAEYEAAEEAYNAGRYAEAENRFKAIAKKYQRGFQLFSRNEDGRWQWQPESDLGNSPLEEDALFMIAQSQFKQRKFSWAQDSYTELLNQYPSSRHLDSVVRQQFRIGQYWLGFAEVDAEGEIQQTASTQIDDEPQLRPRRVSVPIVPNVSDRSRPVFDTEGRALQALKSIWLNDATGPLADDALMLTASHYLRKGDYVEAARYYALLREQYPDSPHFKNAYLHGSFVELASYSGPEYDGQDLEQAAQLKETALRLFPDLTDEQRSRLQAELREIQNQRIEREWETVEFYQRKSDPEAVRLYCNRLISRYPDSPQAERARRVLQGLAAQTRQQATAGGPLAVLRRPIPLYRPRRQTVPSTPAGEPETDVTETAEKNGLPVASARQTQDAGPAGQPAETESTAPFDAGESEAAESKEQKPGIFSRFLRRTADDPELQPIELEPTSAQTDETSTVPPRGTSAPW